MLIIIIIVIITLLFIFNHQSNQEQYHNLNTQLKLIKKIKNKNAYQGVIHTPNMIIAVNNKQISIIKDKITKLSFKKTHLNGGIYHPEKKVIILVNNPNLITGKQIYNSLEIFNPNMKHLTSIPINLKSGSLTWIAFYKHKLYGCIAFYKKDNYKTSIIEFNNKFQIVQKWRLPKKVTIDMFPYSSSGGAFYKNKLYISGHHKSVLYVLEFVNNKLIFRRKLKADMTGQGISFDEENDVLYTIDRKNRTINLHKIVS